MSAETLLPSWRPGAVRDTVLGFVADTEEIAPRERVAIFDNDGTLWCEKPAYPQVYFFVAELRAAAAERPALADRLEYRAVLDGDHDAIAALGLQRVALALVELFAGMTAEEFDERVERFFVTGRHPERKVPFGALVYTPMVELLDLLHRKQFRVFIGTAGGADFVRAVSEQLYGVARERVIGTRVTYRVHRNVSRLHLTRTARLDGEPNEGPAKLPSMQRHIGRRPLLAAGNSPGDAEMLEFASTGGHPSLALLVDHDDDVREYAYESLAGTFVAPEPILTTAERLGWTVISMRNDWETVFGGVEPTSR